jgi:hypothetical protein
MGCGRANVMDRQLRSSEGTIPAQPAAKELRGDGADNAVPKFDIDTIRRRSKNQKMI